MTDGEAWNLEQIREFLTASGEYEFRGQDRKEIYVWLEALLCRHEYWVRKKEEKGLLRSYAEKVSGLSRAQVTRLIARYRSDEGLKERQYRRHRFHRQYTASDVELLGSVDEAHETLSGPATRRILEREFTVFGRKGYERLAKLSVAHLYNLRKRREYREKRLRYEKTRPAQIAIGERRRPQPKGRPGYLRVDTVHQGDGPQGKGLYHVNAVDEVTQWEVVGAVEMISEAFLLPILQEMLQQFPFRILGFHSDNGSEYINHRVARMLNALLIEQTKSRPRRSNDNGLAESKNGAVIRKLIGYGHIEPEQATLLNEFYRDSFNFYLNFHRPSAQPEVLVAANGKRRTVYKRWATPWEVFAALEQPEQYLKAGETLADLAATASHESDTECARRMQLAKRKLFTKIRPAGKTA